MEKFIYKTNIKCNGCKTAVTAFLNQEKRINKWEVDLNSPDKILTIEGENIDSKEIVELLKTGGYKIEAV